MSTSRSPGIWGDRYFERKSTKEDAPHAHDTGMLACLESGLLELRSELGSWAVFANTVTYVPAGFVHAVRPLSCVLQGWTLRLPDKSLPGLGRKPRVLKMNELLQTLCKRIVSWNEIRPQSARDQRLLAVTLDEIRAAPPGDMYQLSLPTRAGLLHVANTCLEQQNDKHGLDHYAKLAAMSRRAFTRAFADETGVSFSAWRNRARVQMALRLLSDGESVTRVGMQLGYASTSSFITMFRRLVGRSPARYARELIRPPS